MSATPSLYDLQKWMKAILTDPRGASTALKESQEGPQEKSFEQKWIHIIVSDETHSGERLDIYAEAYFSRILEAFSIDFPITKLILTEDPFAKLIAEYLKVYPSKEYNLNNISWAIVPFIKTYTTNSALWDVVTLEKNAINSFYSPINNKIDLNQLQALTPEHWEKIKFKLNPSFSFMESTWPLEIFWSKEFPPSITEANSPNYYLLHRNHGTVELKSISSFQYEVLSSLKKGTPLSEIETPESTEENISQVFSHWVQNDYFESFYF